MDEFIECKDCRGYGELLTQGNYYDFEPPTCKCIACDGKGVVDYMPEDELQCLCEDLKDMLDDFIGEEE